MKKLFKLVLILTCFAMYVLPVSAQNMYVRNTNGTQDTYALSSISKLTFSGSNVTVHNIDNSSAIYAINETRYISFSNYVGVYLPNEQENMLTIYPNPVSNILNISLPSDKLGGELLIVSLDGKTLISQKLTSTQTAIDLSVLSHGIYLCNYVHGEYSKTVKIIKEN